MVLDEAHGSLVALRDKEKAQLVFAYSNNLKRLTLLFIMRQSLRSLLLDTIPVPWSAAIDKNSFSALHLLNWCSGLSALALEAV